MTPHQKRTISDLTVALLNLIMGSGCSNEVKGKAYTIVDYYLFNPFETRQPGFFRDAMVWSSVHQFKAEPKYVPLLSMLLLSSYDLLMRRIEMLDMIDGLTFTPATVLTKTQLQDRFVEALALYTDIDHSNLEELMNTLPLHAFGGNPQPTGLKDLAP